MHVHGIVCRWIWQEQSRGYDVLPLYGCQYRMTWYQVFHR